MAIFGARVRLASVICLFAISLANGSSGAHVRDPKPIKVDQLPDRVIVDVGNVFVGETTTLQLHLRGRLKRPLRIKSITTDCGCLQIRHDPHAVSDDGDLVLDLELAPTQKVGRIRRNVRVFFAQEPTAPLDLGLDTVVFGPLTLGISQLQVGTRGEPIEIGGRITSPNISILSCDPVRGSCRSFNLTQTGDRFRLNIQPLISFGSVNEILRFRYQTLPGRETVTIDLPIEIRCDSPIRFFPSIATIGSRQGVWHASSKLVLAPGNPLDFQSLELALLGQDGNPIDASLYRIDLTKASVVLYSLDIRCTAPADHSNRPTRLQVSSPDGDILASLDFSCP